MPETTVYATGLTCEHCAMSVTEELEEIDSVTGVKVDVVADGESAITIKHREELTPADIETAISEAGFHLVK